MKKSKLLGVTLIVASAVYFVYHAIKNKKSRDFDKQWVKMDDISDENKHDKEKRRLQAEAERQRQLEQEMADKEYRDSVRETTVRKLDELEKHIRNEMALEGIQYHLGWLKYHVDDFKVILDDNYEYLTESDKHKYNTTLADVEKFIINIHKEVIVK